MSSKLTSIKPRVIIDGIIYSLQHRAGITVYTEEVVAAMHALQIVKVHYFVKKADRSKVSRIIDQKLISDAPDRIFERVRAFPTEKLVGAGAIFHSSYYRVPTNQIPSVTTVHDMTHELMFSGLRSAILRRQKFMAIQRADVIIAISRSTRNDIVRVYPEFKKKRIEVIHNGVSECFHRPRSEDRKSQILFVGSRKGYKDFPFAVELMTQLTDFRFAIVGGGALSAAETSLLYNRLGDRFDYLGALTTEALSKLYQTSTALLYPSRYEGFGLPPLEAMRSGCIAIVRDTSSLPEVVGTCGLTISDQSVFETGKTIAHRLSTSEIQELRLAGYEHSAAFSWDACARAMIEVYRSIDM